VVTMEEIVVAFVAMMVLVELLTVIEMVGVILEV
jgi:hypothetical protein